MKYYFKNFENLKFSLVTAEKSETIINYINTLSGLSKDSKDIEIPLILSLDLSLQKMIAGVMYLIEAFPKQSIKEILETLVEQKSKTENLMELYIILAETGNFLCILEFLNFGAEKIANLWNDDKITSEYLIDNFEVNQNNKGMHDDETINNIKMYTKKYIRC